ncbi:MAG: ribokinase [Alphaproteobacteria bacterium]|nr:ribokinase [Alphaproteobacteria bacterium]
MFSTLLAKVGLPVLVRIVAEVLASVDNPVAKSAEKALKDVENILDNGGISPEQMREANRHLERIAELNIEQDGATLSEINKSLRAEIASQDAYVRRMRPTFGYLMAFTWAAQMFGLAYVIVFETGKAPLVLNAMGSLGAIWGVGLSVLGIYVYKRSEDKKLLPPGPERIFWTGERVG